MENEKQKVDEKAQRAQMDVLIGAGKEMAVSILGNAVRDSQGSGHLQAQMFVVQVAACHLLANIAFNYEKQGNVKADKWLDDTLVQIKLDLDHIKKLHAEGKLGVIDAKELQKKK